MSLPILPRLDPQAGPEVDPPLATAAWLSSDTVSEALASDISKPSQDILLGKLEGPNGPSYIGYSDDRHIVTIAGSRSGKGTSLIIPNLLNYSGSVVVIDPKGENAKLTSKYRAEMLGQHVIVLDPFNVSRVPQEYLGSFNPLSSLDVHDLEIVDDATSLADAIIVRGKSSADPHWDDTARMLIKATILFVLVSEPPQNQTLVRVKELISEGYAIPYQAQDGDDPDLDVKVPPSFEEFVLVLKHADDFEGAISAAGHALQDMGEKELGSVLSTARRHLEFVSSLPMQDQLAFSSFDPANLRDAPHGTSIYLVLPEYRLASHARWLRLLITVLFSSLQRMGPQPKDAHQTLFILDEFASLGYLEMLERAASYIAGFGVKLWSVLQDLNQLKDLYNRRWETFIGNAGVITAFANTDTTTLDYLSKRLGQAEITKAETSITTSGNSSKSHAGLGKVFSALAEKGNVEGVLGAQQASSGTSVSQQASPKRSTTPLLRPDEIAQYFARKSETERDQEMLLSLIAGAPPIRLQKLFYYLDDRLRTRI